MGVCAEKIVHEKCGHNSLQVFRDEDGGYNGHCFYCNVHVAKPYEEGHEPPEIDMEERALRSKAQLAEIEGCSVAALPERKLKLEALEYFNIKVGVSGSDGVTPASVFFPYPKKHSMGYKCVTLGENKQSWSVGAMKGADPFGWQQALESGAKKLFIVEGEYDAVALWQALKDSLRGTKWSELIPAVISLPFGSGSAVKTVATHMEAIKKNFKETILVFDNDEPGQKATKEVLKIAPDFQTVELPLKDANDMVKAGRSKALAQTCSFKSAVPKNTSLVWGSSLHDAGRKEAEWGVSWPWKQMTEDTRGIRTGETIYIGAGVKMGKSEVVNALASHLILEHKWKVFMAKPEEANRKSYQMVVGKAVGRIFHDPKIPFDYEAYDRGGEMVMDYLAMVNLYQHMGWETLKADITAAAIEGCKAIIIDPITNLTNGMPSGEANIMLQTIAQELAAMALDLDVVIFIFCHLKAPSEGKPHERGGVVQSHQFAGSRAMMR